MGLRDLNEELHSRDFHLDRMSHDTAYDPAASGSEAGEKRHAFEETGAWQPTPRPSGDVIFLQQEKRKHRIALVLGGMAILALLIGSVFKIRSLMYSEEQILFSVNGPRQVASAELSEFTVVYSNQNWSALENASLLVSYPDGFQPDEDSQIKISGSQLEIPLGTINARTDGKATFSGKFYGSRGETLFLKMRLRYSPASFSSQFEKEEQYGVSIASSLLALDMIAPQQASSESVVEYALDYMSQSDKSLSNIRVNIVYPPEFTFVSAEPAPSEGNSVWYIGTLNPEQKGKIIVKGKLTGAHDEVKKVEASIGYISSGKLVAYGFSEQLTRMVVPPLSIVQTINGKRDLNVNAGDRLNFDITYRNESQIGFRDAIVTMHLNSDILDYLQLKQEQGSYDASNQTLVWKASDIPGLARLNPGEGGTISFTIPVLNPLPKSVSGKNFFLQTTAKIDSPDIPTPLGSNKIVSSNTLVTKINSAVSMALYLAQDDSLLVGKGPIPPVAGQETLYTLKIRLNNEYNDVTGAKLVITLPSSSRYQKKIAPDSEAVEWNERTNTLVWDLGTYRAVRGENRELRFQVAATPDISLTNENLLLINKMVFTGKDQFTKEDIRIEKNAQETKDIQQVDGTVINMNVQGN
jgi:hypothetical protein